MSKRTLQRLNYTVGGIQLVLFVFLIVWLLSIDSESVSEDGLVSFPIGEYNQPLSEGRDHGSVSIETIVSLLAIFTLITGLVHIFAYARSSKSYQRGVEQGTNWVRWVEYSITATIMLFVIAVTCGTNSTDGLVLMSVATLCCMLCGYISEATATTNKRVSMLATGVGWLLLLAVFTVLLRRFWSIYTQTQGTDSGPPPWVWAIVISLTLLFMSFGSIHLIHMRKQWQAGTSSVTPAFHQWIEVSYTVSSVVAKTLLVTLLASGLFARTQESGRLSAPSPRQSPSRG